MTKPRVRCYHVINYWLYIFPDGRRYSVWDGETKINQIYPLPEGLKPIPDEVLQRMRKWALDKAEDKS